MMVKISRFTDFATDADYGKKFVMELDSTVKTVQSESFFFSFFIRLGSAEGDATSQYARLLKLTCQSTNLAQFKRNSGTDSATLTGGFFNIGGRDNREVDGQDAYAHFGGVTGTGGGNIVRFVGYRFISGGGASASGAHILRANRWYLVTVEWNRSLNVNTGRVPLRYNAAPFGTLSKTPAGGVPSVPQSGIKFTLEVGGARVDSVHISNVWCACEDTEVADFIPRSYVKNFISSKGEPIEIAGDGTIGSITPVFYFKGENDDPLLDSVSQAQATHNAGNVELYEKDFSVFAPHFLGSHRDLFYIPDDQVSRLRGDAAATREGSGLNESDGGFEPPLPEPCLSLNLTRNGLFRPTTGTGDIPYDSHIGCGSPAGTIFSGGRSTVGIEHFNFSTTNPGYPISCSTSKEDSILSIANSFTTNLLRATGDYTTIERYVAGDSKPPIGRGTSAGSTGSILSTSYRLSPFGILYDKPIIDGNPQIDWFGDPIAFVENFIDSKKRKVKDGGLFGEDFLGVEPYMYVSLKTDWHYFTGLAQMYFYSVTGADLAPEARAAVLPPEETQRFDAYGFEVFGYDYLP